MSYDPTVRATTCPICSSLCNLRDTQGNLIPTPNIIGDIWVDCERCGDFIATSELVDDWPARSRGQPLKSVLASNVIRAMQKGSNRPRFDLAELESLIRGRGLATVGEAADSLIRYVGDELRNSPGHLLETSWKGLSAVLELRNADDVYFITESLEQQGLITFHPKLLRGIQNQPGNVGWHGSLTFAGWHAYELLRLSEPKSRFAFFARKFDNPDLDRVYRECLEPAVRETGYELRTVTQRAGLIDAIIEDEIRRCRFVLADLSDDNAGAYWEAGLAEGLRKPVIYICRAKVGTTEKKTHFDANHRHTVRWSLDDLEKAALELKASIRNTLLGDAK